MGGGREAFFTEALESRSEEGRFGWVGGGQTTWTADLLCHLLAVWLWAEYFPSLNHSLSCRLEG